MRSLRGILGSFVLGQSASQAINIIAAMAFVRLLPLPEFAALTLCLAFTNVGAVLSDLGVAQAFTSLGSRLRSEIVSYSKLFSAADAVRRRLALIVILITPIAFAFTVGIPREGALLQAIILVALICANLAITQRNALLKAVLSTQLDINTIGRALIAEAVTRAALVVLVSIYPTARTAMIVNLVGALVATLVLRLGCKKYLDMACNSTDEDRRAIARFFYPLIPSAVYFAIQGQLAILILGYLQLDASTAALGALGRLGQIVGILTVANLYLVQPYFARIVEPSQFRVQLSRVLAVIGAVWILLILTVIFVPGSWIWLLGSKYSYLLPDLPLAMLSILISITGSTMYSIAISSGETRSQLWYVPIAIGGQVLFAVMSGFNGTRDALLFNLIPALAYLGVQSWIVLKRLRRSSRRLAS
jgi:O-antigen/teichoic acid export membrane protein